MEKTPILASSPGSGTRPASSSSSGTCEQVLTLQVLVPLSLKGES